MPEGFASFRRGIVVVFAGRALFQLDAAHLFGQVVDGIGVFLCFRVESLNGEIVEGVVVRGWQAWEMMDSKERDCVVGRRSSAVRVISLPSLFYNKESKSLDRREVSSHSPIRLIKLFEEDDDVVDGE